MNQWEVLKNSDPEHVMSLTPKDSSPLKMTAQQLKNALSPSFLLSDIKEDAERGVWYFRIKSKNTGGQFDMTEAKKFEHDSLLITEMKRES